MYKVIWWYAYGKARESELMDLAAASKFLHSMSPDQDAELMYVRIRE